MRENRTCGSEGGEAQSLPYPYPGQRSSLNTLVNHYTNRPQAAPHMPNNHAQKTPITPKFHQPKFRSTEMAIQRHINAFNDGLRRLPHGGRDARARAPTMACCQHGGSPCGGFTLTPKSKLTALSRGGVGSKLR